MNDLQKLKEFCFLNGFDAEDLGLLRSDEQTTLLNETNKEDWHEALSLTDVLNNVTARKFLFFGEAKSLSDDFFKHLAMGSGEITTFYGGTMSAKSSMLMNFINNNVKVCEIVDSKEEDTQEMGDDDNE